MFSAGSRPIPAGSVVLCNSWARSLFNFNTFDAMIPSLSWFEEDLVCGVHTAGRDLFSGGLPDASRGST